MWNTENVTFGASKLNRAAHLRANSQQLCSDPTARTIILWRGKPLIKKDNIAVVKVTLNHPITKTADAQIFLGLDTKGPIFASDISKWQPGENENIDTSAFVDQTVQSHPDAPNGSYFAELRAIMALLGCDDAEIVTTAKGILGWHTTHPFCAKCGAPTVITQSGWQRNCPECKTAHFPRTDPVVIMLITHNNKVLLGRSSGWPEKMYSLLAGFMEPGEIIEAAVRREVFEESGVSVGAVGYLASQPWPFPSSLMIGCWGKALSAEIIVDKTEVEDALWVSKEHIVDNFCGTRSDILPARNGSIARFLIENWIKDSIPCPMNKG